MQCELKNCSPSSSETTIFITLRHGGTAIGEVTATSLKSAWKSLIQTLPKALRTQALTALTSNFGLIGLVQYVW